MANATVSEVLKHLDERCGDKTLERAIYLYWLLAAAWEGRSEGPFAGRITVITALRVINEVTDFLRPCRMKLRLFDLQRQIIESNESIYDAAGKRHA